METLTRYIFIILTCFLINCEARTTPNNYEQPHEKVVQVVTSDTTKIGNVKIESGQIVEIDGYDVSIYDIDIDYLDIEINQLNKNHVLCLAATECDFELIKQLINDGADPNMICDVDHILTEVSFCEDNALEITKEFISAGGDINGSDEENSSFLLYSIMNDNLQLVDFLLANGADPNQQSTGRIGCLPIHAVQSVKMLEILIEKGIDYKALCRNGRNILHSAIQDNAIELAKYIIKNKLVDINAEEHNGETPLDYATRFGRKDIIDLLN